MQINLAILKRKERLALQIIIRYVKYDILLFYYFLTPITFQGALNNWKILRYEQSPKFIKCLKPFNSCPKNHLEFIRKIVVEKHFSHRSPHDFICSHDYATSNEQTRMGTGMRQTKERKEKGRTNASLERCFNLHNDRSALASWPRTERQSGC